MEIDNLFEIGDEVYFLRNNKVHSGEILSRKIVEAPKSEKAVTESQEKMYMPFGDDQVEYALTGVQCVRHSECYESRESLAEAIKNGDK